MSLYSYKLVHGPFYVLITNDELIKLMFDWLVELACVLRAPTAGQ